MGTVGIGERGTSSSQAGMAWRGAKLDDREGTEGCG